MNNQGYVMLHHHMHDHHVVKYTQGKDFRPEIQKLLKTKIGRKLFFILILLAIISAILLTASKLLSGETTLGHPSSGADNISPYTSLLFPVSGLSCESYTMTKYYGSPMGILTSMYILNKRPELSSIYNFSIHRNDQDTVKLKVGEFYQWSFLLHAGSTYEVNSCIWEGDMVELIVIQGEAKFREWIDKSKPADTKVSLKPCNSVNDEQSPTLNSSNVPILTNGKYFFIYSNPQTNYRDSQVSVNMSFTKLEYSLNENEIHCNCSLDVDDIYEEYYTYECCGLPLSFTGFVLVRASPQNDDIVIDWEDKVYVT